MNNFQYCFISLNHILSSKNCNWIARMCCFVTKTIIILYYANTTRMRNMKFKHLCVICLNNTASIGLVWQKKKNYNNKKNKIITKIMKFKNVYNRIIGIRYYLFVQVQTRRFLLTRTRCSWKITHSKSEAICGWYLDRRWPVVQLQVGPSPPVVPPSSRPSSRNTIGRTLLDNSQRRHRIACAASSLDLRLPRFDRMYQVRG